MTITNMGMVYMEGWKDFARAEEMAWLALYGHEKSLWKDHEHTKDCARNLNILEKMEKLEEKAALEENYPRSGL